MEKMIEIFKKDLTSNVMGRKINIKVSRRLKGLAASQNSNEEQGDATGNPTESDPLTIAQRQHVWVTTMDQFRKSLMTIHKVLEDISVKMETNKIKVSKGIIIL